MDFQNFIDESWKKHDGQTSEMVKQYEIGLQIAKSEFDLLAIARLVTHVATEHDFKFDVGLHYLEKINLSPILNSNLARLNINRQVATIKHIQNQDEDISQFSVSDRVIIFITTAAALLYQKIFEIERVDKYLQNAVSASHSLKSDDPAFKPLAMNFNNMASFLFEKAQLTEVEKKVMIDASHYSRNFWEKAGTWLQIERAEFYLSRNYRKISEFQNALKHAELCLSICLKEKAPPLEMFFANEALADTYKKMDNYDSYIARLQEMKNFFNQCSEADQLWMHDSLSKSEQ